jgi:hypothetical protein
MPSTALYNFTQLKLEPVQNPDLARTIAVKLPASVTYSRGTILGELTATPGTYKKYDSGGADGSQVPKAILAYDVTTDASGHPTGVTYPYPPFPDISVPAYTRGEFDCATINTAMGDAGTLLQAALAAGLGKLIQGTAAAGIVQIG